MTEPKQPEDHPKTEDAPASSHEHAPNGVPPDAVDGQPKAKPTSDRQFTETAASPERHTPE